ncbi:MAG: TetR/AcrR family transcriptional regulator [Alphaproteobacteria bacterium]
MTRPSRNQDALLIEAGKKLLPEVGVSGMSLKMVADKAGVNLGMFHYYFKTKSNFISKVLEAFKEDMNGGDISFPKKADSIEKLKYYLNTMGKSFRDNRQLAIILYRDMLNNDAEVIDFLISNFEKKEELLMQLIKDCQKDGYIPSEIPISQLINFCVSGVKTPIVIAGVLENMKSLKTPNKDELISDDAIAQRVEMILNGIVSSKEKSGFWFFKKN